MEKKLRDKRDLPVSEGVDKEAKSIRFTIMKRDEIYKKYLVTSERALHMQSAAEFMRSCADLFGVSEHDAGVAGLYHDIARDLPLSRIRELSKLRGHTPDTCEEKTPLLLHTYASAFIMEQEGITESKDVLDAVERHAVAGREMSPLARLLYVADLAEPRRRFPEAAEIRKAALKDPMKAYFLSLQTVILYLSKTGSVIHPWTLEAYNQIAGGVYGQ